MAINYDKYLYSTGTHYIANSGKDENSGIKGGAAGDQSTHEAELRKWYSRPWTVCLRYPNQAVALKIAELSIAMCLNNKVGYDQNQRTTYWKQLKAAGYDPSKITIACEEDCTAGVSSNVKGAGHIMGINALEDLPICTSRNMRKEFVKAGFIALTDSKYLKGNTYLLPGDILLYESHHAACNITLGSKVKEQWRPEVPTPPIVTNRSVVVTGSTVNVRSGPDTKRSILGVVRKGDKLTYINTYDNGWFSVEYKGKTGAISNKYSELI